MIKINLEKLEDFCEIVEKEIPTNLDVAEEESYSNYKLVFDQEIKLTKMTGLYLEDRIRIIIRKNINNDIYWIQTFSFLSSDNWSKFDDEISQKEIDELGGIEKLIRELAMDEHMYFAARGCSCALNPQIN